MIGRRRSRPHVKRIRRGARAAGHEDITADNRTRVYTGRACGESRVAVGTQFECRRAGTVTERQAGVWTQGGGNIGDRIADIGYRLQGRTIAHRGCAAVAVRPGEDRGPTHSALGDRTGAADIVGDCQACVRATKGEIAAIQHDARGIGTQVAGGAGADLQCALVHRRLAGVEIARAEHHGARARFCKSAAAGHIDRGVDGKSIARGRRHNPLSVAQGQTAKSAANHFRVRHGRHCATVDRERTTAVEGLACGLEKQ